MEQLLLKEACSELFLHYIDKNIALRPKDYECPQINNILVIDEQMNVLTCCVFDRHRNEAVLGKLTDLTFADIAELKNDAPLCKKCQHVGIDYSIHNPMAASDIIGVTKKSISEARDMEGNVLPIKMTIDAPANQSTLPQHGILFVYGWCLYGGRIDRIEIYWGEVLLGAAQYGLPRQDVYNVFPEYQDANAGFKFATEINLLPKNDNVTISVIVYTNGNIVAEAKVEVFREDL